MTKAHERNFVIEGYEPLWMNEEYVVLTPVIEIVAHNEGHNQPASMRKLMHEGHILQPALPTTVLALLACKVGAAFKYGFAKQI